MKKTYGVVSVFLSSAMGICGCSFEASEVNNEHSGTDDSPANACEEFVYEYQEFRCTGANPVGFGVVEGDCRTIIDCSPFHGSTDLFSSIEECWEQCFGADPIRCSQLRQQYNDLTGDEQKACEKDADCKVVPTHCSFWRGCFEAVNSEKDDEALWDLGLQFAQEACTVNDCSCADEIPEVFCRNGRCGPDSIPYTCKDFESIDFGPCEQLVGYAVIGGECGAVSGCESYPGYRFFESEEECHRACPPSL